MRKLNSERRLVDRRKYGDEYRHFYFYKRFHFHIYWLEKARKLFALGQYPVEGIKYIAFKGGNVYVGKYFVVRKPKSTGYF